MGAPFSPVMLHACCQMPAGPRCWLHQLVTTSRLLALENVRDEVLKLQARAHTHTQTHMHTTHMISTSLVCACSGVHACMHCRRWAAWPCMHMGMWACRQRSSLHDRLTRDAPAEPPRPTCQAPAARTSVLHFCHADPKPTPAPKAVKAVRLVEPPAPRPAKQFSGNQSSWPCGQTHGE